MAMGTQVGQAELGEQERTQLRAFWELYGPRMDAVSEAVQELLAEDPELGPVIAGTSAEERRGSRSGRPRWSRLRWSMGSGIRICDIWPSSVCSTAGRG